MPGCFFSDTHFGKWYDVQHASDIVDKINSLDADIVVFGGDLLDNYARDSQSIDLEALAGELSRIQAHTGKFAVWGNHDYGGGASRIYEDFMAECGFRVLNDESVLLAPYNILLVGYDDILMGWTDPSLYTLKSDGFHIIIAHEPVVAQKIQNDTGENFLFSGHTHGGQVNIPYFTAKALPTGCGKFVHGLYDAEEIGASSRLQMYTSSGIGMTKYPLRFLRMPEIICAEFSSNT